MTGVAVEHVSLRLGAFALHDISFALEPGETFVILGPSGAGKSVLLETIAGFYYPDAGRIQINGREVTTAPPEARRIGLMFQDYALFPHLTVAQNIQFARHVTPPRARELLARLGLEPLAHRRPANLSGGEKQRVALARALAMDPALFLFDEPLSALDARTRDTLREELKTLLRQLGVPAIYVTHDQAEALVLADRMAVLRAGELQQVGAPAEIFGTPANEFVANFVGVETVLPGQIVAAAEGTVSVAVGAKILHALDHGMDGAARQVLACIRPEDVALSRRAAVGSSVRNQFTARVVAVTSLGPLFKITLDAGFPLVAYVTKQSYLELELVPGTSVVASVKATAIHLITR
jgi:molybdopterin-binding protein